MPRKPLAGSSSVPTLPAARGTGGPSAGSRTGSGKHRPPATPSESITILEHENSTLRLEVLQQKKQFGHMFMKDFKSPARRRLEPMKKLLFEQSEATSDLVTKASVRQQQVDAVMQRMNDDDTVQERRMHDVLRLQQNLEYLEDQLAEADADAAEACDREDTYSMMEQRLHSLVAQDQAKINEIQRVIDESVLRLNQWHAVSKEGEAELTSAEAELADLRGKLKTERHTQRKMMGERRTMVESMVQYTKERNARSQHHKDRLLAARGDLNAEQEGQVRPAPHTSACTQRRHAVALSSSLRPCEACVCAPRVCLGVLAAAHGGRHDRRAASDE